MKNLFVLFVLVSLLTACAPAPAAPLPPATDTIAPSAQPPMATDTTAPATQPVVPTDTSAPAPEPSATPTSEVVAEPEWVAFVGTDGNLRLVDRLSGETRDLTTDALAMGAGTADQKSYQYWNPRWSSDGQFLAYQRDIGTPIQSGYDVTYELWVYDMASGTSRVLPIEGRALGIAWKPGTHLLAYGAAYDEGYFTNRGEIDPTKAKGIWAIDVDSGQITELVAPQNNFSLRAPQWSPNGQFVSFEEVSGYEGMGYFAYYDFEAQQYKSFEQAFGFYDWSPDSTTLVHDDMTYTATGTERIYLRPLGGESQQLSPDYEMGYAFWPRFDPSGQQVAYFANLGDIDSQVYTLFVQPVSGGEPVSLGEFEYAAYLSWLPDGSGLVIGVGPWETRQVIEISLADKSVRVLADGDSPALRP
jgi:hypothetical protein